MADVMRDSLLHRQQMDLQRQQQETNRQQTDLLKFLLEQQKGDAAEERRRHRDQMDILLAKVKFLEQQVTTTMSNTSQTTQSNSRGPSASVHVDLDATQMPWN